MTYTPDKLVTELNELGYPVTKRRLTDWSQKGLLPPTRSRGLGQRRGKVYYWEDPDILHRAIDVFDLLGWHRRAQDVLLPLWVLGYDVSPAAVLAGLQKHIDGWAAGLDAAIPFRGDRADLISDLIFAAETQMGGQNGEVPIPLAEAFLHAFVHPTTPDWGDLITDLRDALTPRENGPPVWPEAAGAARAATLVRDQLSVSRIQDLMAATTERDLTQVHRDLKSVMQCGRAVANVGLDSELWMFTRLFVTLGTWAAVADLAFRRAGHGATIDRWITDFVDGCHRLLTDPRLRAEMQRLRAEPNAGMANERERDDTATVM